MEISCRFLSVAIVLMFAAAAVVGEVWASPATISISPGSVSDVPVGETFTVDVAISDITNLYGWQFNVTFNPNILKVEKVSEGPFLKSVNDTMMPSPSIYNDKGYVLASAFLWTSSGYPAVGATGSGILANITFTVKSGGSSALRFDETMTYLRTVESGVAVPIDDVVKQDGAYGGGGGGGIEGIPFELIVGGVAVVVVVAVVAGVIFLRRRRE